MTTTEILSAVMALDNDEQMLLFEQLLERLSPNSVELDDKELTAELQRRKEDFVRGTAAEIPWSVLRDEPV